MTTKIEITITENDSIYFIYVYRESTCLHKFKITKNPTTPRQTRLKNTVCKLVGESVTRLIEGLLKGGD